MSTESKVKVKKDVVLEWMHLVALSINDELDGVLRSLRGCNVITEEEEGQVTGRETGFEKKNYLVAMIRGKGDGSCTMFVAALRSSGNDAAAELFLAPPTPQEDDQEVQEEGQDHTQLNQEGLDFASEMEKEMDSLIQSEEDVPPEVETVKEEVKPEVVQEVEEVKPEVVQEVEEVKPEVTPTPTPRAAKVEITKPSEEKEFILHDDKKKEEPKIPTEVTPSIVAMNRGMFEKGGAGKKNVSFAVKKTAVPEKVEIKEEERSESPVKNLKDFFQKMGSVDKGDVPRRNGAAGGAARPKTMI